MCLKHLLVTIFSAWSRDATSHLIPALRTSSRVVRLVQHPRHPLCLVHLWDGSLLKLSPNADGGGAFALSDAFTTTPTPCFWIQALGDGRDGSDAGSDGVGAVVARAENGSMYIRDEEGQSLTAGPSVVSGWREYARNVRGILSIDMAL